MFRFTRRSAARIRREAALDLVPRHRTVARIVIRVGLRDLPRLRAFIDAQGGDGVVKPLDGCGGQGVLRVRRGDPNLSWLLEIATNGGRVPVEVRNLPPGVRVIDVGLNGVLINETENRRKFVLEALPDARAIEQPIIVAGDIETRAGGQQNSYAAEPVMLKVQPKMQASSSLVNTVFQKSTANK